MLKEEFKINVGEMNIIDKKAKANPDKGEIRFYLNEGLLFFEWKNLTKNITKEPLVITPGDWIWKKIGTSKGRVYMLQNTLYPEEEKFLFYMQFPISLDEKNSNIINNILKTGTLIFDNKEISNENKEQNKNNNNQNLNNNLSNNNTTLQNNISNQNTNQQNNQNNINSNLDFIKNFTEAFRQAQKKYPKLGKILTRENIINLLSKLNENEKNELIKKLPEKQQSIQGFHDNISSPQFQQGLDALSSALNSENLQAVIQSFGLDLNELKNIVMVLSLLLNVLLRNFLRKMKKKMRIMKRKRIIKFF